MVEVLGTSLLLAGILLSMSGWTETFVARQTLQVKADRVANAALAADTTEEVSIELEMGDHYYYRYRGGEEKFQLKFDPNIQDDSSVVRNTSFSEVLPQYDRLKTSTDWRVIGPDQNLYVRKLRQGGEEVLEVTYGEEGMEAG